MKDCQINNIPREFRGQTTHSDYGWHEYRRPKLFCPPTKPEKPVKKPPPHRLRDVESYSYWREDVYVPFNFYFRTKDIIQTNPYAPFALKVKDNNDEEVRKTRPRVYMAPAISMDDIDDLEMRQLFCRRMYTTEFRNAEREAAPVFCERIPPNTTYEQCADPARYRPTKVDILELNVNDEDEESVKGASKLPGQDPFKEIIPKTVKDEISQLISQNELRLPHDYPKPGYTGYRPILAKGVTLPKRDYPTVHPDLSVAQAIASRWKRS